MCRVVIPLESIESPFLHHRYPSMQSLHVEIVSLAIRRASEQTRGSRQKRAIDPLAILEAAVRGVLTSAASDPSSPPGRALTAARDLSLETIRLEQDGRVLTATYASPPLNFATTTFLRDLDLLTAIYRDFVIARSEMSDLKMRGFAPICSVSGTSAGGARNQERRLDRPAGRRKPTMVDTQRQT